MRYGGNDLLAKLKFQYGPSGQSSSVAKITITLVNCYFSHRQTEIMSICVRWLNISLSINFNQNHSHPPTNPHPKSPTQSHQTLGTCQYQMKDFLSTRTGLIDLSKTKLRPTLKLRAEPRQD